MSGEKTARQIDVFRGDPHALAALGVKACRDVFQIGHIAHVDPGLRRGDDDIGAPEAERRKQQKALVGVGDLFAHEGFARHAQMRGSCGQLPHDFGSREKGDLDARQIGDRAAIIARAPPLREFEPGAGEKRRRVLLQPPLGGNRDNERRRRFLRAHEAAPAARRSIQIAAPTAGISAGAPRRLANPS